MKQKSGGCQLTTLLKNSLHLLSIIYHLSIYVLSIYLSIYLSSIIIIYHHLFIFFKQIVYFFIVVLLQLSQFPPLLSLAPSTPIPTVSPHPVVHVHGSFIHVL